MSTAFSALLGSRKFLLVATGAVVILAARMGLNADPVVVYGIVVFVVANILGISIEDAAKKYGDGVAAAAQTQADTALKIASLDKPSFNSVA